MTVVDQLRSTFLSIWLGAALFFSFAVAPTVFVTLRAFDLANANEIAGTIVTRTLAVINVVGLFVGLLALLIGLKRYAKGAAFAIQMISLALLVVGTTVGHFIVAARMHALRVAMGTIDLTPLSDPRRLAFTQLHVYSVALLSGAMLATLIAIIAINVARQRTLE